MIGAGVGGVGVCAAEAGDHGGDDDGEVADEGEDSAGEEGVGPDGVAGEPDVDADFLFLGEDLMDFREVGAAPVVACADAVAVEVVDGVLVEDFDDGLGLGFSC